jgi:hypothetical protein
MLIFAYLKEIILGIVGFFAFYLFNKNRTLKAEKEVLSGIITNKDKVINVQNKVIEISTNIERTDINSSIDRLSKPKSKK